jgi:hypothetical protein
MANVERPGRKVWFFLAIAVIVFGIWSAAVAATTEDDCGAAPKEWQVFPPEWQCNTRPGFG